MSDFPFNLLDDPWIPCAMRDRPVQELGLRAVLAQAQEIAEIVEASPLVVAALHRLLLAVIHRVADGPKGPDAWHALRRRNHFAMEQFDAYFARWRGRFALFEGEYPFYQWPGLGSTKQSPVAKLTHELASGNNATLFDHTTEQGGSSMRPAQAARYLVAAQSYSVGGLVSYGEGEDPSKYKSAYAAPLVRGAMTLVKGASLFETLLLNTCRYDPEASKPFAVSRSGDLPAWERRPPREIEERPPHGYLDYLTWQSRRILLQPERDERGEIAIRCVAIMKGNQFTPGWQRKPAEVLQAFRKLEKPAAGQDPWLALGFQEDRALWRDSQAFMQSLAEKHARPQVMDWLAVLANRGVLPRSQMLPIDLYGMSTDKAKVLFWRQSA